MATIILGDIVEVIKETVHNPQESGFQYFVGLEHYDSGEPLITRYATPDNLTSSVKHFAKGDILVARRNVYLKRASLVDFEGVTSGDSIVLRAKDKKYQQILPFILNSDDFWDYAEQNSDGTMSKRLSPADLLDYEFEEPENIELLADKLWAAYRVKESYKKLLAATDDMLKAKFQEMFIGQGIVALSVACDIVMGTSPDSQYYNTNCEGLPFYQGKTEFTDMYIGGAEVWCTKPVRVAEKDEILMSVRAPVGAINIAAEKCCIGRGLCSLKPKDNVTKLLFVFYALKLQEEEISRLGTGSTFKAINKDQVYNKITLPLPPLPLQQQFVEIATQAEATKESLRKSIENIDQVIKSLINQ